MTVWIGWMTILLVRRAGPLGLALLGRENIYWPPSGAFGHEGQLR